MDETKILYKEAQPILEKALAGTVGESKKAFAGTPEFRRLFLHKVDHPVGYYDGGSWAQPNRALRRFKALDESQKGYVADIAEGLLDYMDENHEYLTADENRDLLRTANQLTQHLHLKASTRELADKREDLAKRIGEKYVETIGSTTRVPEWDSQLAENRGFWHMEQLNGWAQGGLIGQAISGGATYGLMHLIDPETARIIGENIMLPLAVSVPVSMVADQFLMRILQDGVGKSPVFDSGMITSKHYSVSRHPMYGARMLTSILGGLASLNPIGAWFSAKGIYHGTRACEEQDERLKILHGGEAREFQERVPYVIPGSNLLMKGLEKVLPRKMTEVLEKPMSHYLEIVPFVKSEPGVKDIVTANQPNAYVIKKVKFGKSEEVQGD